MKSNEAPIRVSFEITGKKAAQLRETLALQEIPESFVSEYVKWATSTNGTVEDCSLWTGCYTYPDKETAKRVISRLHDSGYKLEMHEVNCDGGLPYRAGRRVLHARADLPKIESPLVIHLTDTE